MLDFITTPLNDLKNKLTGTTPPPTDYYAPQSMDQNNTNVSTGSYAGGSRRCTKKHKRAGACNKMKGRKGRKGRKSHRKRH